MADRLFFISYKSEQVDKALKVKAFIEDQGFLGWLDNSGGLIAGDAWKEVIDNAIRESVGVIVLVSAESMQSQYVTYEWSFAMGLGKRVIPIFLQDPQKPPLLFEDEKGKPKELVHPKLHPQHMQHIAMWDEDHQQWDKVAEVVQSVFKEEHIPPAINTMRDALFANLFKRDERIEIFNILRGYDHQAASDLLAEFVELPHNEICAEASITLAGKSKFTDERAYRGLELAVGMSNISSTAVDCLVGYDSKRAIDILVKRYEEYIDGRPGAHKETIVAALSKMNNRAVEPVLVDLFHQGSRRNILLKAFVKFQTKEILPDLIENMIAKTLNNGDFEYHPAFVEAVGGIHDVRSIEAMGDVVNHLKVSQGNTLPNLKSYEIAIRKLGELGSERALEILKDAQGYPAGEVNLLRDTISKVEAELEDS